LTEFENSKEFDKYDFNENYANVDFTKIEEVNFITVRPEMVKAISE